MFVVDWTLYNHLVRFSTLRELPVSSSKSINLWRPLSLKFILTFGCQLLGTLYWTTLSLSDNKKNQHTYSDVCWCMLTYADVHSLTSARLWSAAFSSVHNYLNANVCWRMLAYADICWRMLTSCGIVFFIRVLLLQRATSELTIPVVYQYRSKLTYTGGSAGLWTAAFSCVRSLGKSRTMSRRLYVYEEFDYFITTRTYCGPI